MDDPAGEGPARLQVATEPHVADVGQLQQPAPVEHGAVHGVAGVVRHQLVDLPVPGEAPAAGAPGERRHRVAARQQRVAGLAAPARLRLHEQLVAVHHERREPRAARAVDAHGGRAGGERGHRGEATGVQIMMTPAGLPISTRPTIP